MRFGLAPALALYAMIALLGVEVRRAQHFCLLKRCGSQDGDDCRLCYSENVREWAEYYCRRRGAYPSSLGELHRAACGFPDAPDLGVIYRRTPAGFVIEPSRTPARTP